MCIKTHVTTQRNRHINVTINKLYYKVQVDDDGEQDGEGSWIVRR